MTLFRSGVKNLSQIIFLVMALSLFPVPTSALPAFPGAEGFGTVSTGGRGGIVVKVTSLDPEAPGGLQEALDINRPRIIVFEVSGVIRCTNPLILRYSNVYIAGQTAPGAGITIDGRLNGYGYNLHDITIRYLRFRLKQPSGNFSQGDCISLGNSSNSIIDHCSFCWGTDEVVDIYAAHDWTFQWCTIEESDPIDGHNFGFINRADSSGNISFHHNLVAHHLRRAPCISPCRMDWPGDIRNNVIYDVNQCYVHDGERTGVVNIVNNYYKYGPSHSRIFPVAAYEDGTYYITGNYLSHYNDNDYGYFGDLSGGESFNSSWVQYNYLGTKLTQPAPVPPVVTQDAEAAYELVCNYAGCFPRDTVTRRTIEEVRNGTGTCARNAVADPTDSYFLAGLTSVPPLPDGDNDGMPDNWEEKMGLNPADSTDFNDTNLNTEGYTNIEVYVNSLVEEPALPILLPQAEWRHPVSQSPVSSEVSIYTINGVLVRRFHGKQNLSGLARGVYIRTGGQRISCVIPID